MMTQVIAAIIFVKNKLLIARRGPNKHLAGYWEFPGGKIEQDESDAECLIREIKEELGVDIQVIFYFMENQHDYGSKEILLMTYHCIIVSKNDFTLSDHDKVEWVKKSDLLSYNLAPADIPIVKALMNK